MPSRTAVVFALVLAGCAGDECAPWHARGGLGTEATLNQWVRASAGSRLAAAGRLATRVFEFDDEDSWIVAAATIQECINGYAAAVGDGGEANWVGAMAALCTLEMRPHRGMTPK